MDFFRKSSEDQFFRKSSGDRSQDLCKERGEIESGNEEVRKKRIGSVENPETQSLVLNLIAAERFLESNDPYLLELRAQVAEKRGRFDQEERELTARFKAISKELSVLTRPAIEEGVTKIQSEITSLKLEKKVTDTYGGGFSMIPKVTLLTNEDAILNARKIGLDAIEKLRAMINEPISISKIEAFVQETLSTIRKIDLNPCRKEVEQFAHERANWLTSPLTR